MKEDKRSPWFNPLISEKAARASSSPKCAWKRRTPSRKRDHP